MSETLKLFEKPHEDRKFMFKKDQDDAKKITNCQQNGFSCKPANSHGVPAVCCGL